VLEVGSVQLDLRTRRVRVSGHEVALTPREYRLLEVLMRHPDQVLSRDQLLAHAWGYAAEPGTNVVNVYVSALRKKLGEDAIEAVRGVGYRLRIR
jgi:DNA-binding response OmpR family regulator